jgi:multiple sugar transport system permease protein
MGVPVEGAPMSRGSRAGRETRKTSRWAAGRLTRRREQRILAFLGLPTAYLLVLGIFPLGELVDMSLHNVTASNIQHGWRFDGLSNFGSVLHAPSFRAVLANTLIFVAIVTIVGIGGGLIAALALRRGSKIAAGVLALMVFIWALPPVVNGSIWKFLFDTSGLIDTVLSATGIDRQPVLWLVSGHLALDSVAFVNAWVVVPFAALIYRAALIDIPQEVTEAAIVDGASGRTELRFITLPLLKPATLVLGVLTIVYAFRSFDFIYVMTDGGPGTTTTTLPFQGYLQAFVQFDFGTGAATATLTIVLVLALAVVYAVRVHRCVLKGK